MKFEYTRLTSSQKDRFLERGLEILPGLTSWVILIGMTLMAFIQPLIAAIIIIAFDFYWLLRLFYMTIFLVVSYIRLSIERNTDWLKRAANLNHLTGQNMTAPQWSQWKERISYEIYKREISKLKEKGGPPPSLEDIYQLVIYPTVKETREIMGPAIESLTKSHFPPKRMLVVLAVEERAKQQVKDDALKIQNKYRNTFFEFMLIVHPDGLAGEAQVKGANVTYAAKEATKYLEAKKIPFENVIVSCFDADTVVQPDYFSCLTYQFMVCPERLYASYQPIPVYHNNIWEVPGFARILAMGSSFFQMIEATNPEKLVTFSSHSMSFKALIDIGYWPVNMISDDSAVFWKSFLHYDGHYQVVPMYVTISMHVPEATTFRKTIANIYKQQRRWAWGVENFPIVIRGFLQNPKIGFYDKIRHGFKLLENNVAWASWAFLLTIIGWLPAIFAGRKFSDTVLYYSAPRITATIFDLSTLALLITVILSISLLPKKKMRRAFLVKLGLALEWCMVPLIFVCLSALPALDAQTRLMFGQYMEFWVTEKKKGGT